MSDTTGTDSELIRRQQEKDLGHGLDPKRKPKETEKPEPQHGEGQDQTPNPNRVDEHGRKEE